MAQSPVPVGYGGLTGERLDLPSGEFDAALSTRTLCTIRNLGGALAELRRVLKPGGSFHFVEHGHAPSTPVARMQARLRFASCGCQQLRAVTQPNSELMRIPTWSS